VFLDKMLFQIVINVLYVDVLTIASRMIDALSLIDNTWFVLDEVVVLL
jgi:hypothetical protein